MPFLAASLQSCPACDLAALSASGNCMPGSYTVTYSVTNSDGATASADRQVAVYQAASISAAFTLYKDVANTTAAQQIASGLLNSTSQEFADGVNLVLNALPADVATALEPTDVTFHTANVTQQAVNGYSVDVTVSIYVYSPSGVHKKDLDSFDAAVAAAAAAANTTTGSSTTARRRLLQTGRAAGSSKPLAVLHSAPPAPAVDGSASQELALPATGGLTAVKSSNALTRAVATGTDHVKQFLRMLQQQADKGSCSAATGICGPSAGATAHRRRLLQAASGVDAMLASLNTSLVNNMGASGTSSQALTQQDIDLLAVGAAAVLCCAGQGCGIVLCGC